MCSVQSESPIMDAIYYLLTDRILLPLPAAPYCCVHPTPSCQTFKVAMLTCFDINFPELWASARARQADVVVWPSAMVVPDATARAYARLHQLVIVAVSGIFSQSDRSIGQ